jgi:hypothetical protein
MTVIFTVTALSWLRWYNWDLPSSPSDTEVVAVFELVATPGQLDCPCADPKVDREPVKI